MNLLQTSASADIAAQPDFRRLMRHIERACGIFSMVFVIWDRADTEHDVYDALHDLAKGGSIERLPLSSADPADIFRQIEEAGSRRPDVIVVEGLHRAFPDRVRLSRHDRPPILQAMNLYRERLRLHPVCLVLLLPEHALDLVALASPDFWSWRSGVFSLQPPPTVAGSSTNGKMYATAGDRHGDALLLPEEVEVEPTHGPICPRATAPRTCGRRSRPTRPR
jgi:hypothetical protein